MPVPPSQPCGRSVHDENMSRTATFCPIWEGNGGKVQNRERNILELMADCEMRRISVPASPRAQFSLQKNQHREKILNADGQRTNVQRAGKSGLMAQRLGISSYWFCVLTREAPLPSGGCRTTVSLKMPFSATTVAMPSYFSAIAELTASQTHVPCRPWSSPAYHPPCSAALHSYSPHATPPCRSWRLP